MWQQVEQIGKMGRKGMAAYFFITGLNTGLVTTVWVEALPQKGSDHFRNVLFLQNGECVSRSTVA